MITDKRDIGLEELSIEGAGGRPILADLRTLHPGHTRPLVIVCHGFLGYKRWGFFPYLSRRIAAAGFHTLTFSFSLNGVDEETGRIVRPEEFAANTVSSEIEDLEAICRFAREGALPHPVTGEGWGLFGHSRGSAVAGGSRDRVDRHLGDTLAARPLLGPEEKAMEARWGARLPGSKGGCPAAARLRLLRRYRTS